MEKLPRHIRFTKSVTARGRVSFRFGAGDVKEVGVDVTPEWARYFLEAGSAVPASSLLYEPPPPAPTMSYVGGGWYELSDGRRVKGKRAAQEALRNSSDGVGGA